MSQVRYRDLASTIRRDRSRENGGKRLAIAVSHGMATTGTLYNLPPITPTKYEIAPNADLISVGRDMWRAVESFKDEQVRRQA